mgnify:CR=1 FL=1
MKFTQLKYFQTVCKYNNLTRAAEELHISQPGLTHVIHELEQEFDLTLFLRQNKGLILTKKGQQFLNETNLLLEQVDSFVSRMKLLGQVNQGIQFGLSPASATLFFPPILQAISGFWMANLTSLCYHLILRCLPPLALIRKLSQEFVSIFPKSIPSRRRRSFH